MSLVAAYVCGLGAVAYVAHRQTQSVIVERAQSHSDHAMVLLAELASSVDETDVAGQSLLLRDAFGRLDWEHLCLTSDAGVVIASADPEEVGRPSPVRAAIEMAGVDAGAVVSAANGAIDLASDETGCARRSYRIPVVGSEDGPSRTLEGVVRWDTEAALSSTQVWLLAICLVAVGMLGIVYHAMRRHFRGITCIADNLVTHADHLEEELASLRMSDSLGTVACSWNRLIDLVESLRAEAGRSTAASELRQFLERSSSGELADAIDAVPDGLLIVSDGDLLVHTNAAARRLIGRSLDDEGRPRLSELDTGATGRAVLAIIEKARGADGCYEAHSELVECEDSNYRVRVVPQRKSRQHGACVVVVADVSQQVRADRAREEFVSQVTHELRTPLTNIRAYTETLSSGMFDDPKTITECYNVINKETRRLSRLVEDILSMSQLEVGSIQILFDDVDVRALIQEAVRDVRAMADEKKTDLQAILPAKMDPLRADKDKLAVVLNNLLGNALKYTPAGGEIRIGCQSTEDHLLITVKDTGVGIDPSEQEHVFEKFHRSQDPAVQKETGTGIGLTTAREIARRHGGDIELMSEKMKGSTFVVKLPRKRRGDSGSPARSPGTEAQGHGAEASLTGVTTGDR